MQRGGPAARGTNVLLEDAKSGFTCVAPASHCLAKRLPESFVLQDDPLTMFLIFKALLHRERMCVR